MLRHVLGDGHALLYEEPEKDSDESELSSIDRLLEQSPWLRAEVEAGRVSLSASGNTIRYNYAPSYFVRQAELLAENAFGLPPGASEELLKKIYPDYIKSDSTPGVNETWSASMSVARNAAVARAVTTAPPKRNSVLSSAPLPI